MLLLFHHWNPTYQIVHTVSILIMQNLIVPNLVMEHF